jgi:ketosteroid isomerase-like protein
MPENVQMVAEAMLAALAESINAADLDGVLALYWLEDERVSLIQEHLARPIDAPGMERLAAGLHGPWEPEHVSFRDTRGHRLGPDTAYVTTMQRWNAHWTRVTLILLKKGDEWGILHSHFSTAPADDSALAE